MKLQGFWFFGYIARITSLNSTLCLVAKISDVQADVRNEFNVINFFPEQRLYLEFISLPLYL